MLLFNIEPIQQTRIYNAYGVTESGRYLVIGFVKESKNTFRVIHAMSMNKSARQRFKKMRKIG